MAPQVFTVTHQDGTVSRRTSVSAAYAFAIVVEPAQPSRYADRLDLRAAALEREAEVYRYAADQGRVKIVPRPYAAGTKVSHEGFLQGTEGLERPSWYCDAQGVGTYYEGSEEVSLPIQEIVVRRAREAADRAEEGAKEARKEAASVRAAGVPVGTYGVVRWSRRRDLAEKALSAFAFFEEKGHTLRVVPVD